MSLATLILPPELIQTAPLVERFDLVRTYLLDEAMFSPEQAQERRDARQELERQKASSEKSAAVRGAAKKVAQAVGGAAGYAGGKLAGAASKTASALGRAAKTGAAVTGGAVRGMAGAPDADLGQPKKPVDPEKKSEEGAAGETPEASAAEKKTKKSEKSTGGLEERSKPADRNDPKTHHQVDGPGGQKLTIQHGSKPEGPLQAHPDHEGVFFDPKTGKHYAPAGHPIHQTGVYGMRQVGSGGGPGGGGFFPGGGGSGGSGMSWFNPGGTHAAQGGQSGAQEPAPQPAAAPAAASASGPGLLKRGVQGALRAWDNLRAGQAAQPAPTQTASAPAAPEAVRPPVQAPAPAPEAPAEQKPASAEAPPPVAPAAAEAKPAEAPAEPKTPAPAAAKPARAETRVATPFEAATATKKPLDLKQEPETKLDAKPAAKPEAERAPRMLSDRVGVEKMRKELAKLTHPDVTGDPDAVTFKAGRAEQDPQKLKQMLDNERAKRAKPAEPETIKALPDVAKKNVETEAPADQSKNKLPSPSILRTASKTAPEKPDEKAAEPKGAAAPGKTSEPAEPRTMATPTVAKAVGAPDDETKKPKPAPGAEVEAPRRTGEPGASAGEKKSLADTAVHPRNIVAGDGTKKRTAVHKLFAGSSDPAHKAAHDLSVSMQKAWKAIPKGDRPEGLHDNPTNNIKRDAQKAADAASKGSTDPKVWHNAYAKELTTRIHAVSAKHGNLFNLHPTETADTAMKPATPATPTATQASVSRSAAGAAGEAKRKAERPGEQTTDVASYNPPLSLMIQEWIR